MKRRAQRVVRAEKNTVSMADPAGDGTSPPLQIPDPAPQVDIFGKFQQHRDDFDPHWLLLEDDVVDARASPLTPSLSAKLERHRGQLRTARPTAPSSQQHGTKETGPMTVGAGLQAASHTLGVTAPTRDAAGDRTRPRTVPRSSSTSSSASSDSSSSSSSSSSDSSSDAEYVPERDTAKPSRTTPHTAVTTEDPTSREGLSGDFLTFLPTSAVTVGLGGQQYDSVQAEKLHATVTLPTTASTRDEHERRKHKSSRSAASPPQSCVVPLWSVWRMQTFGGYCGESPVVALHQEITDLCDYLAPTQAEISVRRYIELKVTQMAQKLWPSCEVMVFGSLLTQLLMPLSDIDITVLHVPVSQEQALTALAREISAADFCHELFPQLVLKTKVPLVKFQHKGSRVDVDISVDASDGRDNSREVMRLLQCYPEARALIIVIKYFLQQRDMHEPYRGGLGSYATTLLVIGFLQHHPIYTTHPEWRPFTGLGKLLVDFFRYYAQFWNYGRLGLSVEQGGRYFVRQDTGGEANRASTMPGSPRPGLGPAQALVEDPGNPSNNAASSLRNFHSITSAFQHAYLALTANFTCEKIDPQQMSPDANDIALRPTLLSRILHVDPEMVTRRNAIAATYDALCHDDPAHMTQVRQYRRAEDAAMMRQGSGATSRNAPVPGASGAERRTLASLAAAAERGVDQSRSHGGSRHGKRSRAESVRSSSGSNASSVRVRARRRDKHHHHHHHHRHRTSTRSDSD